MKTKGEVLALIKYGRESQCLDSRDYVRLAEFFEDSKLDILGITLADPNKKRVIKIWTKKNILHQLEKDVTFGFEKALDKRGISASLMYEVVKMWMWILDDELQNHDSYAMYGLPLFKAVALKYGFKNEIGEDSGSEGKYDEQ